MKTDRNIIILLIAVLVAILGYKISVDDDLPDDLAGTSERRIDVRHKGKEKILRPVNFESNKAAVKDQYKLQQIEVDKTPLFGERMLHFKTREEMEAFLKKMRGKGLKVVKVIPGLKMVRVRFLKRTESNGFLARFSEIYLISENSPINIPGPLLDSGSTGFRSNPLEFLGIENNANWGQGITVAVIDTGVGTHSSLGGNITHFDLINDGASIDGTHGTAVASLIAGNSELIRGVSPGVELIDIRALNNDGDGDAFTVAEAIVLAVDNGAQVLNLSLGTGSDNPALREAVLYAQNNGVIVVAAVGNEGASQVSYPAAYPGVIGVGSNDADENYLSFSNRGDGVDISAPGIELTAAGGGDDVILFTGTSASAPLVSATIAYQLAAYPELSNEEIVAQLTGSANEAGLPGEDDLFGDGILNVGRIETNSSGQASDTAAAGFYLQPIEGSENMLLYFSGENRGSETIGKVEMTVSYPGFEKTYLFNDIESSQTFYETLVLSPSDSVILEEQEITINVKPADGDGDISNNSKAVKIRLSSAE